MSLQSDFPRISNYNMSGSIMLFCLLVSVQCPDDKLMAFGGELPSAANSAPESGYKRNPILLKIQLQRRMSKPMKYDTVMGFGFSTMKLIIHESLFGSSLGASGSTDRTQECSGLLRARPKQHEP